jgi:hypothetical protein
MSKIRTQFESPLSAINNLRGIIPCQLADISVTVNPHESLANRATLAFQCSPQATVYLFRRVLLHPW